MNRQVLARAGGKINLALTSGPKRPDGYHSLATVFQAVSVYDDVLAENAEPGEISLDVQGRQAGLVPVDERNLAYRAAALLAQRVGRREELGVELWIQKDIPVAGGMAGGSADAAAALVACNELWECGLDLAALQKIGAELGADVPFCLLGHTALGLDRGDQLVNVLSRGTFHWALAFNAEPMPTSRVFQVYDELFPHADPNPSVSNDVLRALAAGDAAALGKVLQNDLQWAALSIRPELREILSAANDLGALGCIISGSGPTVAMLMPDQDDAGEAAGELEGLPFVSAAMVVRGPVPGAMLVH
ncbi:MAG: 4-(cytidine 5'-diphospho)-2-C-methyl-D-erythritol kinase [Propionibacteriaceae bacterium]|jgi:4-diphosphocytidyl-2-C-methyl-D-erythritol kinase|nr:4-(cytidine 5'-diphospho)-2-C-methyl-D-erythritol kinase [Propionibacteriaceae bacterium]